MNIIIATTVIEDSTNINKKANYTFSFSEYIAPIVATSHLPRTRENILATGIINSEFKEAWEASGYPPGSSYTMEQLKDLNAASLVPIKEKLEESRPSNVTEYERFLTFDDGYRSRVVFCHRSDLTPTMKCPLIVIIHGGGHCVGHPESEIPLARQLSVTHDAIVMLSTYRQAPEHPFPDSCVDSWATVKHLAAQALGLQAHDTASSFPPSVVWSASGLHHSRNQFRRRNCGFSCTFSTRSEVEPTPYEIDARRRHNKNVPILDLPLYDTLQTAFKPDHHSPLWAVFDQPHALDQKSEDPEDSGVMNGHLGLPPAYFQVRGTGIGRDDSLLYERVLREECGVKTRADLYAGFAHVWWAMFPEMEMSKKREDDAVAGVGWLLESQGESLIQSRQSNQKYRI
ncbi:putative Alpha/Beta hydrolase protein [Seiridium cardinale]